ncbi:YolD-like family protein [Salicibibacter cibi]|uniref:YolD-like family protein n=1 Tax=Salicibibacter cibi TaxID=2743001 RepID=A0A7T6Z8W4_9BACI|nr:YolD-like family protein [Salicibibacter cibi]QQK78981.1 YolD-like family protein [Salicibibacter cibi]
MREYLQRGNKLWEGSRMFLPQHKQALLDHKKEQQKVKKPELDEQELEELNQTFHMALANKAPVTFTYYQEGQFSELVGYIDGFLRDRKELRIIDQSQQIHILKTDSIVALK